MTISYHDNSSCYFLWPYQGDVHYIHRYRYMITSTKGLQLKNIPCVVSKTSISLSKNIKILSKTLKTTPKTFIWLANKNMTITKQIFAQNTNSSLKKIAHATATYHFVCFYIRMHAKILHLRISIMELL